MTRFLNRAFAKSRPHTKTGTLDKIAPFRARYEVLGHLPSGSLFQWVIVSAEVLSSKERIMIGPDNLEMIVTKVLLYREDHKRPRHQMIRMAEKIAEEERTFLDELEEQMRIFGGGGHCAAGSVSQEN